MSLLDHLDELRRRIGYSLVGIIVTFSACWYFIDEIFEVLLEPIKPHLPDGKLTLFGVQDAFFLYFKVAALAAVFVAAPFLLYQAWCFIAPGLYRRERMAAFAFVVFGSLFFLAGGLFAYKIASPFAIEFLIDFGGKFFNFQVAADRYLRFEMMIILGLGLMFELPIFIFALSNMGVVTPGFLIRKFRYAVLIIFVVSAIITPTPDVVNLMVFALPTIVLYLLGVFAAWISLLLRRRREAGEGSGEAQI